MSFSSHYQAIVVGGGPTGLACACTLGHLGARTLLIERHGFLGGNLSAALVAPMLSFHAGEKRIIGGFAHDFIERLVRRGGSCGHLRDPLGFAPSVTPIDSEHFKIEADKAVQRAGVDVLFHSFLQGAQVEGDAGEKTVRAIVIRSKSGARRFTADYFVDASGDADLCFHAGAKTSTGDDKGSVQPMTTFFKLDGVDVEALVDHQRKHRDDFVLRHDFDRIFYPGTKIPFPGVAGFFSLVKQAKREGRFDLDRDRVLLFGGVQPGTVSVNMTRIKGVATDVEQISFAEAEGRRQVEICLELLQRDVPGFARARLVQLPSHIGVRETRRVRCRYVLTEKDVLGARKFDDGIARGAYPIDVHLPGSAGLFTQKLPPGDYYEIPYRCFVVKDFQNLLVAGRCASFTRYALASARVSAICMQMGEGCAYAVKTAVETGKPLPELDGAALKEQTLGRADNRVVEEPPG